MQTDYERTQTPTEVAEALRVKARTVYVYLRQGAPHTKLSARNFRCNAAEITAWLDERNRQADEAEIHDLNANV